MGPTNVAPAKMTVATPLSTGLKKSTNEPPIIACGAEAKRSPKNRVSVMLCMFCEAAVAIWKMAKVKKGQEQRLLAPEELAHRPPKYWPESEPQNEEGCSQRHDFEGNVEHLRGDDACGAENRGGEDDAEGREAEDDGIQPFPAICPIHGVFGIVRSVPYDEIWILLVGVNVIGVHVVGLNVALRVAVHIPFSTSFSRSTLPLRCWVSFGTCKGIVSKPDSFCWAPRLSLLFARVGTRVLSVLSKRHVVDINFYGYRYLTRKI